MTIFNIVLTTLAMIISIYFFAVIFIDATPDNSPPVKVSITAPKDIALSKVTPDEK